MVYGLWVYEYIIININYIKIKYLNTNYLLHTTFNTLNYTTITI